MKKTIKILILIPVLLLVALVVSCVIVVLSINGVAKTGIEKGGTYALGVKTTLDSATVGLMSGTFSMKGLKVANPAGYAAPNFLTLGTGGMAVSYATLQKDTIELPHLNLADISADLEKKEGKANYSVILDNVSKNTGGGESKPAPKSGGKEKKFIIKELSIKNVKVHLDLLGAGGLAKFDVPIDEIKMKNVGQTGTGVSGTGVTMGQLTGIIVQAVLAAAVEKGGGIFPADVLGDLKGSLASLGDLKGMGFEAVGGAAQAVQKVGEDAKKAVDDVKKQAEGLKNLIPKKN